MDQNQNPMDEGAFPFGEAGNAPQHPRRAPRRFSGGALVLSVVAAVLVAVMLTYTLTASLFKTAYVAELQKKQAQILQLQEALGGVDGESGGGFGKLEYLRALFENAAYYNGEVDAEERLNAVLKAYTASIGDAYAEYFTEEEYRALEQQNSGQYYGIGANVQQTEVTVEGYSYSAFRIISIFKNSPAASVDLRSGDYIVGIKENGALLTVAALGGYTAALNRIRGEAGTVAELAIFRPVDSSYELIEVSVTRGSYVSESVSYTTLASDPTVGIVQIMSFDLTTPVQFKTAVNALLAGGAEHFVFDVRNNPGGDLQSIKAVLSYFLKEGDMILASVDRDGNRVRTYVAEVMAFVGDYASCNVARREIGMYADLDCAVLCNEVTASAAEVFVATMRDYGIAPIVGTKTFGKGIMQSIISLSDVSGGTYDGYVKLTTYAYVTKCGIPYQGIGVSPDEGCEVALSEEAQKYAFYFLPQEVDNQLQAAASKFE